MSLVNWEMLSKCRKMRGECLSVFDDKTKVRGL